jgi:mono/diheme cytochrome c family protein
MRSRLVPIFCALLASCFVLGCRAGTPGKHETATMNWIKRNITVRGKQTRNPLPQSPGVIADGRSAFGDYCMVCHGLDGQNTGVPFAASMSPPVPSLASPSVQRYTDGQLKWIIENGIAPSGMPASRGILSDEEMWSIVEYLRHLPPAGSLGEPRVYSGDDADAGHP